MKIIINEIIHGDCMDLMPLIPELNRDVLAIVDPPYGIGVTKNKRLVNKSNKNWDSAIPSKKYFDELFRISTDQIIWGGNYFIEHLKNTRCFINWDKLNHSDTYADCEMAWTSFNENAKIFKYMWDGNRYGFQGAIQGVGKKSIRIHPTQKPVALYRWLLQNYAKPGQLILDTHSGSGSLACACHLEKYDFIAIEKDIDYYNDSVDRLDELRAQGRLF